MSHEGLRRAPPATTVLPPSPMSSLSTTPQTSFSLSNELSHHHLLIPLPSSLLPPIPYPSPGEGGFPCTRCFGLSLRCLPNNWKSEAPVLDHVLTTHSPKVTKDDGVEGRKRGGGICILLHRERNRPDTTNLLVLLASYHTNLFSRLAEHALSPPSLTHPVQPYPNHPLLPTLPALFPPANTARFLFLAFLP